MARVREQVEWATPAPEAKEVAVAEEYELFRSVLLK
jgi:hypothetical protein